MTKGFEVKLDNGFTVGIVSSGGKVYIDLANPNGYVVSDIELKGKQLEEFKELNKEQIIQYNTQFIGG